MAWPKKSMSRQRNASSSPRRTVSLWADGCVGEGASFSRAASANARTEDVTMFRRPEWVPASKVQLQTPLYEDNGQFGATPLFAVFCSRFARDGPTVGHWEAPSSNDRSAAGGAWPLALRETRAPLPRFEHDPH
jgi:hypothetical protein